MKKTVLQTAVILLLFVCAPVVWALDFGLILDQNAGFSGVKEDVAVDYTATLVPRFSAIIDDTKDIYVSAGLTFEYENEEPVFVFEVLRTEFTWVIDSFTLSVGRMAYADPLDFLAEGLFDGVQVSYDTAIGMFSAGAWYTGLLYKKTNKITMTPYDFAAFHEAVDPGNVPDTYFASKRLVMALGWEHPAIADKLIVNAALTGQFDVNDTPFPYHSQYVSVKAVLPLDPFMFGLGGCTQFSMSPESTNDVFGVAFAVEAGAAWLPPLPFASQLSLNALFTSGGTDGIISALNPITTEDQGNILKASISGLSVVYLDYLARVHETASAGFCVSLFMRSDKGTYRGGYPYLTSDDGHYMGTELFGRVIWSPVSDLQVNLGGGVFLPSVETADPMWRVELGLVLALF